MSAAPLWVTSCCFLSASGGVALLKANPQRTNTNKVMSIIRKSRVYVIRQMKHAVCFLSPCPKPPVLQPAHEWPPSSSVAARTALTFGNFTSCHLGTNQASSVALRHLREHGRGSLFPRQGVMEWLPLALPTVPAHGQGEFPTVARSGITAVKSLSALNCQ